MDKSKWAVYKNDKLWKRFPSHDMCYDYIHGLPNECYNPLGMQGSDGYYLRFITLNGEAASYSIEPDTWKRRYYKHPIRRYLRNILFCISPTGIKFILKMRKNGAK